MTARVVLMCICAGGFFSAAALLQGDAEDADLSRTGAAIYDSCLLCHSTREMQRGPILDGLPAWYVEHQLNKFRYNIRGANPTNRSAELMKSAMSLLRDEEEIERVSRHIAELPPQAHLRTVRGDASRGGRLYAQCVACHGEYGEGNPSVKAPPLRLLEDWYLLDQLRKFKSGERGAQPDDMEGQMMRLMAGFLEPQDMRDVVRFISEELARAHPPAVQPQVWE